MNRDKNMTTNVEMKPAAMRDDSVAALAQVARALFIVVPLWIVSSQGYYALGEALGLDSGYDDTSV